MALALYRQYRPSVFAEVVGQEHVTRPLSAALDAGQVRHAYLFSGPRGCGKTSSARILARSLNCEVGPTSTPCGTCRSCVDLAPEGPGSLDVVEIDAAGHNGVDDARSLVERAGQAPARSRYRVYVLDECHMLTTPAWNAMLKLVEEPPEHLVLLFATTAPDKVIATIRSRVFHYAFRLLPPGVLRGLLHDVLQREGVEADEGALALVVRAAAGSARDGLSVLDQLVSSSPGERLTEATAREQLGASDAALLDAVVEAVAASDGAAVFRTVDTVVESGHDPQRFAGDLLERFRDLLVLHEVPEAGTSGLLPFAGDQVETMRRQADLLGRATLSRAADLLHEGLVDMRGSATPRLQLELTLGRVLVPEADLDARALLSRLERLERRFTIDPAVPAPGPDVPVAAAAPRTPAPPRPRATEQPSAPEPTRPAPPAPAPPAPATSGPPAEPDADVVLPAAQEPQPEGIDVDQVRAVWDRVLAAVGARRKRPAALLSEAVVLHAETGLLRLGVPHAFHASQLGDETTQVPVLEALEEQLGGRWRLEVVRRGSADEESSAGAGAGAGADADAGAGRAARRAERADDAPVVDPDPDPDPDPAPRPAGSGPVAWQPVGGGGGGHPPASPADGRGPAASRAGAVPRGRPAAPPVTAGPAAAPLTARPAAEPPVEAEPSEDDEDDDDPRAGLTRDEAALALVRDGLGGTVISTS